MRKLESVVNDRIDLFNTNETNSPDLSNCFGLVEVQIHCLFRSSSDHLLALRLGSQAKRYRSNRMKLLGPIEFAEMNSGPSPRDSMILSSSSRFTGTQKSKGKSYNVDVIFHHVDLERSYICGYLGITGLIDESSMLSTFFDAEIISARSPFLTRKWDADEDIDRQHWSKFDAFLPYLDTFNSDAFDYDQLRRGKNADFIFMRWKEHFLIPDNTLRNINGSFMFDTRPSSSSS